jgi:hypothetical protein
MKISKRPLVSSFGLFAVGLMVTIMCAGSANAQSDTNALRAFVSSGSVVSQTGLVGGNSVSLFLFPTVPLGKRFVIERLTGEITVTGDVEVESVLLKTVVNTSGYGGQTCKEASHYLSLPTVVSSGSGQNQRNVYNFDLTRRLYAETRQFFCNPFPGGLGDDLQLIVNRIDKPPVAATFKVVFAVSGYLVDLPPPVSFSILPESLESNRRSSEIVSTAFCRIDSRLDPRRLQHRGFEQARDLPPE